MDVKVFRTFLAVAKQRHFGRAATDLYITQAAVSARIKQLEGFFDAPLFVRDRNAIKLTSAGERLVPYAEVMVNTLEQAKLALALEGNKAVQLSIAGTPNIWDAYLQQGLSRIIEALPEYGFNAQAIGREQINNALLDRTLDLGLLFDPMKSDDLVSQEVATLDLMLVATAPSTVADALASGYIYVDWGTRFASEHGQRHPGTPAPFLRTSTARIALDLILEKGGAAYLPLSLVQPLLDSRQLFAVSDAQLWQRPVYLSYRKGSSSVDAISRIQALLAQTDPATAFTLQQLGD
ncbi:LysR family transcriptional regulator [Ferrimonas marina]|uniref:DNA-binding transcriptional regulator, LysR family n=1 Tax=Ferrimonas marina TaxID=299255 RepID=A0A1M5RXH4_9GAMM|nr:LysR family transcriptional regulator [Ferrimonas marina]SHH30493.1 DNA-binding transcriptional regulator, LysR family [Ferrimonas marina]